MSYLMFFGSLLGVIGKPLEEVPTLQNFLYNAQFPLSCLMFLAHTAFTVIRFKVTNIAFNISPLPLINPIIQFFQGGRVGNSKSLISCTAAQVVWLFGYFYHFIKKVKKIINC
jgi:hypothetical protein